MLRHHSTRARAITAAGALGTTMAVAGGVALAQTPAPAEPAPARRRRCSCEVEARRGQATTQRPRRPRRVRPRHAAAAERLADRPPRAARQRGKWRQIDADLTSGTGHYALRFRTRTTDTAPVRVRFGGDRTAKASSRIVGRLNAYRPALASWYGPGLYGNNLGCGGTLNQGTIGVAHKSLPCGTTVVLRNGSRTVRARVIDRGPYVGAREFDLTAATKQRLGFGSVGRVWVAH